MTATKPATETPPASRRWWNVALVVILLAIVGVAVWMIYHHLNTWQGIAEARAALARGDIKTAREQLEEAKKVYSDSDEITFLLAQAMRRDGDLVEAERTLNEAKRLGWVKEAIDFEGTLLIVQKASQPSTSPNWPLFEAKEPALREALRKKHPESANICEVLVPAAVARYEGGKAGYLLESWQKLQPESGRMWEWKGRLAELLRQRDRAVEAYTTALKHVPGLEQARLRLVVLLLDDNRLKEAEEQLAGLPAKSPDAPALRARLLVLKGDNPDEARRQLDALLAGSSNDAHLLHLRGKVELDADKAAEAEPFLEKAYRVDGYNAGLLEDYQKCLTAQGKDAGKVQERLAAVRKDEAQVAELIPATLDSPTDPAPRRQVGEALLRLRQYPESLGWLESARVVSPSDAATHTALANYFDSVGQKALAERHRNLAKAKPKPK
jgi:predicted Zn-dependent protease